MPDHPPEGTRRFSMFMQVDHYNPLCDLARRTGVPMTRIVGMCLDLSFSVVEREISGVSAGAGAEPNL